MKKVDEFCYPGPSCSNGGALLDISIRFGSVYLSDLCA